MTGVQTCALDRKSTRLNSSHTIISYAVFCLKKKESQQGRDAPGLRRAPRPHHPRHALRALAPAPPPPARPRPRPPSGPRGFPFFFLITRAPREFSPFPPPAPPPV